MSFPRYGEYKESGVEWLGNVPSHWRVEALKHSFEVIGGSTPRSDVSEYWDGDIPWVTPADFGDERYITSSSRKITGEGLASCGTTLVPPGSIVLSTRAPIGSIGISTIALCTNQGCKSLVPKEFTSSDFFAYALFSATDELNLQGRGTTFLELSADALRAFELAVPPPPSRSRSANSWIMKPPRSTR